MVYLAATELTLQFPANVSIGTNTEPLNLGEVASIIGEVTSRFDSVAAGAGYIVPVSGSAGAYPMVQSIVRDGAGARVFRVLFYGTNSPLLTTAEEWEKQYEAALKAIMDSDLVLAGAAEDSSESTRLLPRSWSTSAPPDAIGIESGASVFVPISWEP